MIRGKRHKWDGYYSPSYSKSGSRTWAWTWSGSRARAGSKLGERNG